MAVGVQARMTVIILRHGEMPEQGLDQLSCQGLNRALNYFGRKNGQKLYFYRAYWPSLDFFEPQLGGGGEIRTHEGLATLPVFKTGAFNRSATPPSGANYMLMTLAVSCASRKQDKNSLPNTCICQTLAQDMR